MKALLITFKGGEEAAKHEIKELLNTEGKVVDSAVEFEFTKYEQIFKLSYFSQAAERIIVLDDLNNWLKDGTSFRVRCEDKEKESDIGAEVNKENKYKVDLNNPEVPLFQHDKYLGIDFTGDLSKRNFRVFTHRQSLKGTTAFVLLKDAGFTGKESLLDPFAKDGTIILEAVHYAIKKPVKFFEREKLNFLKFKRFKDFDFEEFFETFKEDKSKAKIYAISDDLRDISAIKKNAKIASINHFNVSKLSIDWLDTKFRKEELDLVVSYPPKLSKKFLKELYHQLSFIAKKTVLLVDLDFDYEDDNMKIEKEKIINVGKVQKKIIFLTQINVSK